MADLAETTCPECGIVYAVPPHWLKSRQQDKRNFYCPNGHVALYRESEADKLRRERDLLKQQLACKDDEIGRQRQYREEAERSARAMKGVATRLKNRAAVGLCPCCNRSVRQLAMHMKKQHPDFRGADVLTLVADKAGSA